MIIRVTKPRRIGLAVFLVVSLFFSSGCGALLLLGVGGTGGYLIRKGEEGDRQSASKGIDQKPVSSPDGHAGQELGGTP